jgi:hypothetical protein
LDLFIEGPDTYAGIKYGDGMSPERRGGDGLAIF